MDAHSSISPFYQNVLERVRRVVVGQDVAVERILIGLLTEGHVLLEGKPGVAKTLLVNCVARAVGLEFRRVQFTVDLLPGDIIGSLIYNQGKQKFQTHKGPVFTHVLLADEVNRAAPRVQSALLEAMQERQVTIARRSYPLRPFVVIATRNPIEQSGTFELPEAQLDRFMLCHRIDYPSEPEEVEVVAATLRMKPGETRDGSNPHSLFDSVSRIEDDPIPPEEFDAAKRAVFRVDVKESLIRYSVELIRQTRQENSGFELGCSPRAAISLVQAAGPGRSCSGGISSP
jgi:MoxR-like ATPase